MIPSSCKKNRGLWRPCSRQMYSIPWNGLLLARTMDKSTTFILHIDALHLNVLEQFSFRRLLQVTVEEVPGGILYEATQCVHGVTWQENSDTGLCATEAAATGGR